ncbi:papain-like cysteine protease family protein [Neorhizobium sp. T6_25]|uniref:papain-like cysteine protease family protein n=1 Tax=Neorhizobium sp. T6_25 TaxID=2093833 RepID=UPI000CF88C9E|nr:papain-like cysteine protease family protein [Neorhizobium sp. T6_25]
MAAIGVDNAFGLAVFHLGTKAGIHNAYGLQNWRSGVLASGIAFYDPYYGSRDDPVIYLFDVLHGPESVGIVAIAGSDAIGTTLSFMRSFGPENLLTTIQELSRLIEETYGIGSTSIIPVVYSYPKLGIMGKKSNNDVVIFDLLSHALIHEGLLPDSPVDDMQGLLIWSFWDNFPQAGNAASAWAEEAAAISTILNSRSLSVNRATQNAVGTKLARSIQDAPPTISQHIMPLPLVGQTSNIFCAPASLQMIYRYIFQNDIPQDDIAREMSITAAGSTLSGQLNAYRLYFGKTFEVSLNRAPSGEVVVNALNSYLPVKCGIRGHSRVITGFRTETYVDPLSGKIILSDVSAMVNDPEPVGYGSVVWENTKQNNWMDIIELKRHDA